MSEASATDGGIAGARRLRVLLLITGLEIGGAEKAVYTLATGLDPARFAVQVACLQGSGPYADRLARAGIPAHPLAMRGKFDARVFFRLVRLLREQAIEVLHTFLFHANLVGRLAGWRAGTPVRISAVRVCEERRASHLRWDRWTHRLIDVETCVCEAVRRFTIERAGVPAEKLLTIPNGIAPIRAGEGVRERLRGESGVGAEETLIVSLGRLDPQKAPQDLVSAMAKLCKRPVRLWLAGGGPEEPALREQIARAGLGDRVRLLGLRDDVADLLAAADIFALASRWEGMPNAVLEAMAAGLPVAATAVGGTPELVVEGETGFLVPAGDVDALTARLDRLAADAGLRARLGAAGRARVEREFSVARFVAAHAALYERLWRAKGRA